MTGSGLQTGLPLGGVTVVVTRPREQAQGLVSSLNEAGANVINLPTLEIEPVCLGEPDKAKILNLDCYEFVICVSPNAARLGLPALADYWPQWPVQQKWIAVGPATGAAMADWQLNLEIAQQGSTSESLLQWPQLQNMAQQKVLILRGQGGRETLAQTLTARGAQVDYIELYRRALPKVDCSSLERILMAGERVILTVTSGDGLRNLLVLLEKQIKPLQQCPLIVVSGRLLEFAQNLGFQHVALARSAASEDIFDAVVQLQSEPANHFKPAE